MLATIEVPDPTVMGSFSVLFTPPGRVINSPSNQVWCFSLSASTLLTNDSLKLAAKTQWCAAPLTPSLLCKVMPSLSPKHKIEFRRMVRMVWIDDGVCNSLRQFVLSNSGQYILSGLLLNTFGLTCQRRMVFRRSLLRWISVNNAQRGPQLSVQETR